MKKFKVIVKNEIFGNIEHIMSLEEIKKFNLVAHKCAMIADINKCSHSIGMWTVEVVKDENN